MARRYAELWNRIKKDKRCTVRCKPEKVNTIILCVQKEKSIENAVKHTLELPSFGRLKIKKEINKEKGTALIEFLLVASFKNYEL